MAAWRTPLYDIAQVCALAGQAGATAVEVSYRDTEHIALARDCTYPDAVQFAATTIASGLCLEHFSETIRDMTPPYDVYCLPAEGTMWYVKLAVVAGGAKLHVVSFHRPLRTMNTNAERKRDL